MVKGVLQECPVLEVFLCDIDRLRLGFHGVVEEMVKMYEKARLQRKYRGESSGDWCWLTVVT